MAFDVGLHWHLDDSASILEPQIRAVAAEINPGRYEGRVWNMLSAPERKVNHFKFITKDRSRTALSGVIGTGGGTGWVNNSATANLPMSANAVAILTVGHILQIENEVVVVKSVDRSAFTIDVDMRGHGGSTAAAHADQTAFTIIGSAINDTDAKNVESFAEQTGEYENFVQTVFETIDQTFIDRIQAREAFEQNPALLREAMERLARKCYRMAIRGRKQAGTKTVKPTTAGILHQLSNGGGVRTPLRYNVNGAWNEDALKAALDTIWNAGGRPNKIILNPTNKRIFDPYTEQFIRMSRSEARTAGTDNVTSYSYQGETLDFEEDIDMPLDRVEIVTSSKLKKGWREGDILRGPVEEPQDSSRELRFSLQGGVFIEVYGVGVDHIDMYGIQ